MTQTIYVGDVPYDFPDDMSEEDIATALDSELGSQTQAQVEPEPEVAAEPEPSRSVADFDFDAAFPGARWGIPKDIFQGGAEVAAGFGHGIQQMIQNLRENLGTEAEATPRYDDPIFGPGSREEYNKLWEEPPVTAQIGQGIARALPAIASLPAGGGVATQMGMGALTSVFEEDPATAAAIGIAAPGIMSGVGKGFNYARGQLAERAVEGADASSTAIRRFQELGGRVTPGAARPGGVTETVEGAARKFPLSRGAYDTLADQNQVVVNRSVAKALGVNADEISPQVLDDAADIMGQEFDDIARSVTSVQVPEDLAEDILAVFGRRTKNQFRDLEYGTVTGESFQKLRSKLLTMARGSKEATDKDELFSMIDELDDQLAAVAPEDVIRRFGDVRERYSVLKAIERRQGSIKGNNVDPKALEGAFKTSFKRRYTMNQGTRLTETQDAMDVIRATADPRMKGLTGSQAATIPTWMSSTALAGGAGGAGYALGAPALVGGMAATAIAPRVALGQATPGLVRAAGAAGRLAQPIAEEEERKERVRRSRR